MSTPAFNAGNFVRPALQSVALLLIIVVTMMAMAKPAHATGVVPPSVNTFFGGGPNASCFGLLTAAAVKSCTLDHLTQQHNQSLNAINSNTLIANRPIECTPPTLTELGNIYQGQRTIGGLIVDAFRITSYSVTTIGYMGGALGGYASCSDPNEATYGVITWQSPLVCPANSTGTPTTNPTSCTCNSPTATNPINYVPDTSGKKCISEQYSIALVGLGVVVMPNKTLTTAYALVTKNDGEGKSGAQVTLLYDFVPEDDGYNHAVGQHVTPHEGKLSTTSGSTDANGKFSFVFQAPEAGGTHIIVAGCTNCTNTDSGTVTVPGCPVPPLTAPPFTDPVAQGFENGNRWRPDLLTADYKTKLACVQDKITDKGGTYTGTSAYRPYQYQQHLYEIVDKDSDLSEPGYMTAHPECQALRVKVMAEMGGHGLKPNQLVAEPGTSRHESGTAFDLTPSGLTETQLTEAYTDCEVTHTAVPSEPWHVQ